MLAGSKAEGPGRVSDEDRERLAALGYVGGTAASMDVAADTLADPKDKVRILEAYREASALAGQRRFAEALPLYRKILADDPGMSDVWLQLAQVSQRAGDDAGAAGAFKRALALTPNDSGAVLALGNLLLRLRRLDDAEAHARLALKPAPAAAHELLARIALVRGDGAGAEREAALAHAADPALPLPLYVKGLRLHHAGRFAEALPAFQEAIALLAGRTIQLNGLHYYTGDTLAQLNRYAEAEAEFDKELALFPDNLNARASLAMLNVATGREERVRKSIDDILRSAPTPEGYALAEELWTMFKAPDEARAVARPRTAASGLAGASERHISFC